MASNAMNVFQNLVDNVDSALSSFVTEFSSNLISTISPLVQIGCVLYFIWVGISYVRGYTDDTLSDIGWHVFKVGAIVAVALSVGSYQQYIATPLMNMPDELVNSLLGGRSETGSALVTLIDTIIDNGTELSQKYISLVEFSPSGDLANGALSIIGVDGGFEGSNVLAPILCAVLVIIGTVFCIVVGCFWYLATKILIALMIGIGAVFIVSLIWSKTQGYFSSWLNAVLMLVVVNLMITASFSIFAKLFSSMLEQANASVDTASSGADISIGVAVSLGVTGVLTCATLLILPAVASMLTNAGFGFNGMGGASSSVVSKVQSKMKSANQAIPNAGRAIMNGAKPPQSPAVRNYLK